MIVRELSVIHGIHGETYVNESPFVVGIKIAGQEDLILSEEAAKFLHKSLGEALANIRKDWAKATS